MAQPLDRAVVEVDLAHDEATRGRQRLADDRDLVVLGRDLDQAGFQVLHRVVRGMVTERQTPRPGTGRPPDDLVAQADPKQRPPVGDHRARQRHGAVESGGVAGTRREHDAVDVGREHVLDRGGVRQYPDSRSASAQAIDDVRLESEVQSDHERPSLGRVADVARNAARAEACGARPSRHGGIRASAPT